ncbi:ATP-binding protein [Leifsonia sp. McL0607]|uniref:ATP-binding protein n=1 Tax=Leifsonia sp. McL0607 TaxID=3415672 RepID=UPI003CE7BB70
MIAFVTIAVIGVGTASWLSAAAASTALIESTDRSALDDLVRRASEVAPGVMFPPDRAALDALRSALGGDALVIFDGTRSTEGRTAELVSPVLRAAVSRGERPALQTVVDDDGRPWVVVGAPIMTTAPDGSRTPSGVEVYAARDLGDVQAHIDELVRYAFLAAALSLPVAGIAALVVARGVLRPVIELRDTARRLAAGDLDARSRRVGADELGELAVTVNRMAESIASSVETMRVREADARRFAADVSHELRTPLATLTAASELLASSADDLEPDARESVGLAVTETQRLVRLVEELMEVSRIDAGTARVRSERVAVAEAVRESLRVRGFLDSVELTVESERAVATDRRRLDVMIANLVGNALRHGKPPVSVRVSAVGSGVRVEVTDRGPGICVQPVERVFDRFFKADEGRSGDGSGLGLSLARENARLLGGDIIAENRAHGGARFVLTLPGTDPLSGSEADPERTVR